MTNICIIATIIIYLVAMLLVGVAYSKSNNDSTDFYLGGRKMGPLVTANGFTTMMLVMAGVAALSACAVVWLPGEDLLRQPAPAT